MEDGSEGSTLKHQNVIRLTEHNDDLDEDDVMIPNRMAAQSYTKEKPRSESAHVSDQLKALTKKISDFVDKNVKEPITGEELSQLAYAAYLADLTTMEKIFDTTEDERKALYKRVTPGLARLVRVIITANQPTMMPKPAKPQFPEVKIGETVAKHPVLKDIGSKLMPTQEAVNFFTKLKFEAAALVPPYTPYPAPKLMDAPWTPKGADVKRAVQLAEAKQKRYGVKENYPSLAQLALAHLRAIVAGEVAGAWEKFGGLGAQLNNMAEVMETALKTNQETAARLITEQNQEWQQLARDRHDINQIAEQLKQPNQLILSRVIEDQKKDFLNRAEKGKPPAKKDFQLNGRKDFQKKGKAPQNWKQGGAAPYYKKPDGNHDRDNRFKKRQRDDRQQDKGRDSPRYRARPDRSKSRKKRKTADEETK